jgi:hypothetical protein
MSSGESSNRRSTTLKHPQELQDRYERERIVDERRIKRAFETGRIPDPERREHTREAPVLNRVTQRGEGIHRGDGLHL